MSRSSKMGQPLNKMPANVQITSEQLIREANEKQLEVEKMAPRTKITDKDELDDYRLGKRKEFEDNIRKNRHAIGNWLRYAKWEELQNEFERCRSVYERALDIDSRNVQLYLRYAEFEMKNRQVNHARNIWDRAVSLLPRVNQFWYKYTYMEEMLGNIAGARQIFERWMTWHPEENAWFSYIKFELRYKEVQNARQIYEKFVSVHFEAKNWIRYAKFELLQGQIDASRAIFDRALQFYGDNNLQEELFVAYAKFEEGQKEYERARVIYKYSLDRLPKERAKELFEAYTTFEKKHGDKSGVEAVIVNKRKFQYEKEVAANPHNYDAWFDYVHLCEAEGDASLVRDVYERAIANVPPAAEKRLWRRYIYLWIYYAVYEELDAADVERARDVYKACLGLIPHNKFTFAKIWLLYAHFEVRNKDLKAARQILGTALGKAPKDKLYRGYIELELQLREFDRCRTLYEKFLQFNPANCSTWIKYAELESILGETDRARGIYELAVEQPLLDMPEVLWKSYIEFEKEMEEYDNTRQLYARLLRKAPHVKVWISYANFEAGIDEPSSIVSARQVYENADKEIRKNPDKAERVVLLEAWKKFEESKGTAASVEVVAAKMPRKIIKRRQMQSDDGSVQGWEEYYDYMFPDDEANQPHFKLLEMAKKWKQNKTLPSFLSASQPTNGDEQQGDGAEEGDAPSGDGGKKGPGPSLAQQSHYHELDKDDPEESEEEDA